MALCVLGRRVSRLHRLPGLRKDSAMAQVLPVKVCETDGCKGELHQWEASFPAQYRLYYSPSSCYSVCNFASFCNQANMGVYLSTHAPSFWQLGNGHSVNCLRYLSSNPEPRSNPLLELAFNKESESPLPSESLIDGKPTTPVVKVDTRAFQRCRPEYASITLDLTQKPHPVKWQEIMSLLKKVVFLNDGMKPSDISQLFVQLSHLESKKMPLLRYEEHFIMLLRYSVKYLHLFTIPQLMEVLRSLVWLNLPRSHRVFRKLEDELSGRVHQMSLHQLLLTADLWRCIRMQVPLFLQSLYCEIHSHLRKMEVAELVQLVYLMGEGRKCPKDLCHPVERLLMLHLDKLHPEEVGTIVLGLFKTMTLLSEHAVNCIVEKAYSYIGDMSDFAMVNVLKYLRFSRLYHKRWMESMVQEVLRRVNGMDVKALMHTALACSALHWKNDQILMAIAEQVPSVAAHCRTKDSCKLLWAFGSLRFLPDQSPSFYPSLLEALRQKNLEFQKYPEHLLSGLLGLIFVAQFPEDLIALALSPDFVRIALESTRFGLLDDLFTLDGAVGLELPQWTGPRLSCELREEATEVMWKFANSELYKRLEFMEAEALLRDLLGGKEFVCKTMILPFTRSIDLEVHLDAFGKPIPVNPVSKAHNESLQERTSQVPSHHCQGRRTAGLTISDELLAQLTAKNTTQTFGSPAPLSKHVACISEPDEDKSKFDARLILSNDQEALRRPCHHQDMKKPIKLAIQVYQRNQYCYHSQQLLGFYSMKMRQLKLAGYQVVELPFWEWSPLVMKGRTQKLAYLHCKLYDCLK